MRFSEDGAVALGCVRELMSGLKGVIDESFYKVNALRYSISLKHDGSPVTEADVFLEGVLSKYLEEHIPAVIFIGEESYNEASSNFSESRYIAILDPIDGTENFCSGLKEWGVSFSLWYGSSHLGSMLYMPELDELLMTGDELKPIYSRIRGFSSSMCGEILQGMAETRESRLMGCAVYNLYNVIRGSYARFTNPRGAYSWDLLPGLMLALEHNCKIEVEGKLYHGEFLPAGKKYRVDIWNGHNLRSGEGAFGRQD